MHASYFHVKLIWILLLVFGWYKVDKIKVTC